MDPILQRLERQAIDLSHLRPRSVEVDRAEARLMQNRMAIHDDEIRWAIDIARRYEDNTAQKIKAAAAGLPILVNWKTTQQGTSTNSFTTLAAITPTQQNDQCPAGTAESVPVPTLFNFMAFGIYGTASTAPTMQVGIGLNGAAPTSWVTALTTLQASQTVALWNLEFQATVLTSGSSGTIQGAGDVTGWGSTATAVTLCPVTQAAALTWNTTQNNYFNMGAGCGTSSASNLIQVNAFFVVQYN